MGKKYSFLINFLLIYSSIIFGIFLSELIIRIILPQQLILIRPDVWCPDPVLGWRHCPNVSTTINSGEGKIDFNTDHNGFRIDPNNQIKTEYYKIIAIGDSFVEGIQVNNYETVTEEISQKLSNELSHTVSVINSGVGGWDPNQYLLQAKLALQKNKYDLGLIFIYIANDIVTEIKTHYEPRKNILNHEFQLPLKPSFKEITDKILYPINDTLEMHSHLFVFLKNRFSVILMRLGLTGHSIKPVYFKKEADSKRWYVTAKICSNIADIFKNYNIPTIFILIPADYQVDEDSFEKYLKGLRISQEEVDLDQPNRLLMAETKRFGLEVIDPLPQMRSFNKRGKSLYGKIDNHLNANGHRILAELVLPLIKLKLQNLSKLKKQNIK
jgi:lysophospholipase L1-like esterase